MRPRYERLCAACGCSLTDEGHVEYRMTSKAKQATRGVKRLVSRTEASAALCGRCAREVAWAVEEAIERIGGGNGR